MDLHSIKAHWGGEEVRLEPEKKMSGDDINAPRGSACVPSSKETKQVIAPYEEHLTLLDESLSGR